MACARAHWLAKSRRRQVRRGAACTREGPRVFVLRAGCLLHIAQCRLVAQRPADFTVFSKSVSSVGPGHTGSHVREPGWISRPMKTSQSRFFSFVAARHLDCDGFAVLAKTFGPAQRKCTLRGLPAGFFGLLWIDLVSVWLAFGYDLVSAWLALGWLIGGGLRLMKWAYLSHHTKLVGLPVRSQWDGWCQAGGGGAEVWAQTGLGLIVPHRENQHFRGNLTRVPRHFCSMRPRHHLAAAAAPVRRI